MSGADFGRDFRLKDTAGRVRTLADFRGKLLLVFFGFVQCPVVCPTALIRAVEVRRSLAAQADKLQVVFVTLDPERDTPDIIDGYTAAFDPKFIGLYTDLPGTEQVAREFRIYYQKVPLGDSYTIDHTAYTYIYDALGSLRLAAKPDLSADQLAADLRLLLAMSPIT